ncbi:leucine-rich repeat protein [Aquimarina sp. AU474]|uniref:leucine-rich repeat protein n=1 Tax=Aquimarina sp. AU474 TaxID=2108529 RepID=UPI000D69AF51|nr:leucine-rich repeat protein [Aquimarina sp. AU474]
MSKMEKQLQLIMSAIFIVLAGFSVYGQNVGDQFTDDNITYEITSITTAEVRIVVYEGSATEVDIPGTVLHNGETYAVTLIGEDTDTFQGGVIRPFIGKGLIRVTIPNTVTTIGLGAFTNNKLTEVEIPNSVTHIRRWGFSGNSIEELNIPANVEYIGPGAFFGSQNIPIVRSYRNPPPEIDETAFSHPLGPSFIKMDLVVPFGSMQAYEDAGWKDLGFENITSGVTNLDGVRYGIIDTPNEVTVIGNAGGVGFNMTIPPTVEIDGSTYPVTAIGDGAFRGIGALLTVIIQGNVKRIGFQAFHSPDLNRVTLNSTDPPMLDEDAFEYPQRHDKIKVIVPKGKVQAYKDAGWTGFNDIFSLIGQEHNNNGFIWEVTSTSPNEVELHRHIGLNGVPTGGHVEIPSKVIYFGGEYLVTSIGDDAMRNTDSKIWDDDPESIDRTLNTVHIPESVTKIGKGAFADNQLTEVTIPEGVTEIGDHAFAHNQLTGVEIPTGVTSIGEGAFLNNNLESVEIPNSVTSIEEGAFSNSNLTSVTIPSNVSRITRWAYSSNKLTEVTISSNVTAIELYAFEDNPDLRLVTVEANDPPALHKDAFSDADRDQIDVVVPMGSRQTYLDNGWGGFRSISFGNFTIDGIKYAITSSREVMVVDYSDTTTAVIIPETVDHGGNTYDVIAIGEEAFQNNELVSVEIPSSVTSIGEMAFSDNLLTEVTIPGSVQSIGSQAFYNNPTLDLVTVGANTPPALDAIAFVNANRHQIDLVVPMDTRQAYLDNGWSGFRSISDGSTPPRPTIDAPQNVDGSEPFTVNIRFDDEVTDFGLCGIQVANAMVSDFTGSGSTYTVTIVPELLCDGNITINVPANMVMGTNSLSYLAAQLVNVAVVDTIAPTITCAADVEANASDNGTGDCTTTVDLGTPVTADNCSVTTVVAQVNGTDIDPDTYEFGIGETTVTWIVTDDAGNTASCGQIVTVATGNCSNSKEPLMDFNRGFSPNGDGIGDTLVIEGLEAYGNNVVKIYDLSQRLLFSAHYGGPGDGWDGTHKGGRVPVGSYVCVIDYNESGLDYETKMIYVNY